MLIRSHPVLIVLLSSVSTSAARLILRLLTPCTKETVTITNTGKTETHKCAHGLPRAHSHTSADSEATTV